MPFKIYLSLNMQNLCIQKYRIPWSLSILKSVILSNSSFVGRHFEAVTEDKPKRRKYNNLLNSYSQKYFFPLTSMYFFYIYTHICRSTSIKMSII